MLPRLVSAALELKTRGRTEMSLRLVHAIFQSALLFPKKSGTQLQEGRREVDRVYGKTSGTWQLLHITFHPVSQPRRRALLTLLSLVWLVAYPAAMKLRCSLLALSYSFMEFSFTRFERGRAYTSAAQFGANLIYMPVLVDVYEHFFRQIPSCYILLFPLNIWILELIQGLAISYIFGYNVAWCYADYADEFCFGFARIGHAVWWWGLGLLLYVFYPTFHALCEMVAG